MDDASSNYPHIRVNAFAPNLGAEIQGVDISGGISDAFAQINRAFKTPSSIFQGTNRNPSVRACGFWQKIWEIILILPPTMDGPEIFEIHANKNSKVANGEHYSLFHAMKNRLLGQCYKLHILPECGGDTMFINMYDAIEDLSPDFKRFLDG